MTAQTELMRQLMLIIEAEEKTTGSIQSSYKAGKKAFYASKKPTDNPHEKGQFWEAWDRGFKAAKAEDDGTANW